MASAAEPPLSEAAGAPAPGGPPAEIAAKVADFAELRPGAAATPSSPLDSLLNVTVTVSAELGRRTLPIGEVLKLGVGSVLELDRAVFEPVDLVAQGIRLARGEVVVVDDRFAVRIKEIVDPKKKVGS
jgi:flagellar motor switch protein FliN/FliY